MFKPLKLTLWIAVFLVLACPVAMLVVARLTNVPIDQAFGYTIDVLTGKKPLDGDRTPGEINRYLQKRLSGHPKLESLFLPALRHLQTNTERPVPNIQFPTLGKGQQAVSLKKTDRNPDRTAASAEEIRQATRTIQAGQILEIKPGTYHLGGTIVTGNPGSANAPITVRASVPGSVIIELDSTEGFQVVQPYWIFENLVLKGRCANDSLCEHAFHIVGKAHHTILRNNRIEDFNAHLKINGNGLGDWPDDGIVQYNTLTNTRRRETYLPTTPFDLVGASRWLFADNIVSNFIKGQGDQISYGVFMKGAGWHGRIERNLIICTLQDISQPGVRVGISFGSGGTGKPYCRDNKQCEHEHSGGIASNNIVAHCNDFGIDVNRSRLITIAHNTLINTSGIDVRQAPASARIYGNLLEGRIRARNGAQIKQEMNEINSLGAMFESVDEIRLEWRNAPETVASTPLVTHDFCNRPRTDATLPGAFAHSASCP